MRLRPLLFAALLLAATEATAETPASGDFIANKVCPAHQSFRKHTNPGGIFTESGKTYRILAKNRSVASHFLIEIVGADPSRRWVAADCGEARLTGAARDADEIAKPSYVLAVSWQPAFCEQKPNKTECETQTKERFDATHFTLHGLWPQPRSNSYCNVDPLLVRFDENKEWDRLPPTELSDATRAALAETMPGTASFLDRHEWIKHGVCFQHETSENYFARALALMTQLNASKLRALFAANIDREITRDQMREALDASFGPGANERMRVACKRIRDRNLIVELTFGLAGEIGPNSRLGDLLAAAAPTDMGCPRGTVDPVGVQ